MRNPATLSRPAWGNCGRSAPNDYWSKYFWVTHGGASGCDYLAYPSGPPNPDKIVWETLMGGRGWGKEHYTLVTEGQDWRGAGELWQWMYPTIKTFGQHLNLSGESPWVEDAPKGNSTPKPANGGNGKPPTTGGNTYQVVKGDSLSLISGRFYGDVLLWPVIWDRNKAVVGNNPNLIYPGQRLTIPSISAYNQSQLSSIRQRGRNC
ncbi:MAG: LysM peptidoglycan-binding domain-containing protein [Acidobacteria bacterium]|nr:LysM peptidoglycan-binding domain-containing protein [Acidobacteriota bacterium]